MAQVFSGVTRPTKSVLAPVAVSQPSSESAAIAIVQGLLVHDQSIQSLEWHGSVFLERNDGVRVPVYEGAQAFEGLASWAANWRHYTRDDNDVPLEPLAHQYFVESDGLTRAYNPRANGGLIRPEELERMGFASPWMLLGRHIDWSRMRRMGELLLGAENLRITQPDNGNGCVTVRGLFKAGWRLGIDDWREIEVTVDTTRSFVPVHVAMFDDLWGYPMEEFATTRVEYVAGVWVPTRGWRVLHEHPLHAEWFDDEDEDESPRAKRFAVELTKLGIAGTESRNDPSVRAKFREALSSAFDGQPLPLVPVIGVSTFELSEPIRVNVGIAPAKFMITFPNATRVGSAYVGTLVTKGEPEPDVGGNESDRRYWAP